MSEQRLRFLISMNQKLEELLTTNPGDPVSWPDAAKLRLHALWLDKFDLDREVYDRTSVQEDLRRIANRIEELGDEW